MMGMAQERQRTHKSSNHPRDQWTKILLPNMCETMGHWVLLDVWLQILEFGGKQPKKSGATTPKLLIPLAFSSTTSQRSLSLDQLQLRDISAQPGKELFSSASLSSLAEVGSAKVMGGTFFLARRFGDFPIGKLRVCY